MLPLGAHVGASPGELNDLSRASVFHFLFIAIAWLVFFCIITGMFLQELEKNKSEINFVVIFSKVHCERICE